MVTNASMSQYARDLGTCILLAGVVVINTDCEGVCYRIYARQKFQIMPERRQTWGIYYHYKDRPTWFQEISLYFYEVTWTRTPPYCFECMIALKKKRRFYYQHTIEQSKQHFRFSVDGYRLFYSPLILCTQTGFRSLCTKSSGLYNIGSPHLHTQFARAVSYTRVYLACV